MAFQLVPRQPLMGLSKTPMLGLLGTTSLQCEQVRTLKANRHQKPEFKNLRRLKVQTTLPVKYMKDFNKAMQDGVMQNLPNLAKLWKERDFYVSCSSSIIDAFEAPENQNKAITEELRSKWSNIGSFGKDKLAVRKIRGFEPEFNLKVFQEEAKELYIKAHECLAKNDQEKLTDYVTEHARVAMLLNSSQRTIRWKYLQSLEEPKVVHVRAFQLDENANVFAQITVRLFSQQCLAVYDRFGRLIYGSEILAKDVLEYAVFEKHLSNEYGVWRLHGKIIPENSTGMAEKTFVLPKVEPEETSSDAPETEAVSTTEAK